MGSVLDSIRSVQESIERIAKQTGTEHLFGDIGYVLGLEDKDKDKNKSTEETQKSDTQNTSDVSVDKPTTSESKSVTDTIRDILSTADKIALESGTERLFENLDEVLGVKRNGTEAKKKEEQNKLPPEFEDEAFFISQGVGKPKRYHQALKYRGAYGMECNACCVMYFLQNYGLLPPNMPRKVFEYLFTVLNPPNEVYGNAENENAKSQESLLLDNQFVKPYQDDLFKNLFQDSSKFLKGFKVGGGAIIPNYGSSASNLFEIMTRFYGLAFKKKYEFLQQYHNSSLSSLFYDDVGANPIVNRYQDLLDGTLSSQYFAQGNTVFVAVDYDLDGTGTYTSIQHYCIVVAPKITTLLIDKVEYHFYPIDDPLNGNIHLAVPHTPKINTLKTKFREYLNANGIGGSTFLNVISPNSAMGI